MDLVDHLDVNKNTTTTTVLLTKVHVESQIVCSKMHQRGNVKKGNMDIGKSFIVSMHEVWDI